MWPIALQASMFLLILQSVVTAASEIFVNITTIRGVVQCNALPEGLSECLGIPFAKAPVGALRWRPPQDWTGPLIPNLGSIASTLDQEHSTRLFDATSYGPSCPQSAGQLLNASKTSEDCLTLNIWSPPQAELGLAPVMVFFYGGGFSQGGSSTYNGSVLAAKHGIVVITANYRLGALGFAAIPWQDGQKKGFGNFGLMDQQSVLRWTQREAASFRGDKARVTIFGQSAGACSVNSHLLMHSSRGLFSRAILESGDLQYVWPLDFSLNVTAAFGRHLNCSGEEYLACLRNSSVSSILEAQGPASGPSTLGNPALDCAVAKGCRSFSTTADGVLLKDTAFELTRKSFVNEDIDIIAGWNTDDGSLFAVGYYDTLNSSAYTELVAMALLKNMVVMQGGHPSPDHLKRALQLYPPALTTLPIHQQTKENTASLSRVLTDSQMLCPAALMANATLKVGRQAWVYRFDYNATWRRPCYNTWPAAYGNATHTAELSFVFDRPLYLFGPPSTVAPPCQFTEEEVAFADGVSSLWTSFARNGVPAKLASWPRWKSYDNGGLVLAPAPHMESEQHTQVCKFWLEDLSVSLTPSTVFV